MGTACFSSPACSHGASQVPSVPCSSHIQLPQHIPLAYPPSCLWLLDGCSVLNGVLDLMGIHLMGIGQAVDRGLGFALGHSSVPQGKK